MDVPSFKEIRGFLKLQLIPKRLYPSPVTWKSTIKFQNYAANFLLDDDGVLYLLNNKEKIKILEDDVQRISAFTTAHDAQHINFEKTFEIVQKTFYWHGMQKDIKKWIECCKICTEKRRKEDENRRSVMLDHSYLSKPKRDHLQRDATVTACASDCSNDANKLTDSEPSQNGINSCKSSQPVIGTRINTISWDHDYIADNLTLRRKLHSFVNDENETSAKGRDHGSCVKVSDTAGMDTAAIKETHLQNTRFHVDRDFNLMPNADDPPFLVLLGLERVMNTIRDCEGLDDDDIYNEAAYSFPPVSRVTCDQCSTDVSPSWHRNDDDIFCTICHKNTICEENEKKAQCAFNDYLSRYNSTFSRIKENAIKTSGGQIGLNSIKKKREEAISHFTKMRKVAMFKANLVTKTLLRRKGIKTLNLPSQSIFTQKIRLKKPNNRLTSQNYESIAEALQKKLSFQRYLQTKLAQHRNAANRTTASGPSISQSSISSLNHSASGRSKLSDNSYFLYKGQPQKGNIVTDPANRPKYSRSYSSISSFNQPDFSHSKLSNISSSHFPQLYKRKPRHTPEANHPVKRLRVPHLDSQQKRFLLQMQARKAKFQEIQRLIHTSRSGFKSSLGTNSPKSRVPAKLAERFKEKMDELKIMQPVKLRTLSKK